MNINRRHSAFFIPVFIGLLCVLPCSCGGGRKGGGTAVRVNTPAVAAPPAAVTLSSPSGISNTSVTLSWTQNNDSDFLRYKVLYSLTSGGALTTLTTITTKTTITYDATGLTPGTQYYFKVYVYDTESLYAGSNEVSATTLTQNAAPTAVTLSSPSSITDISMNLSWTQSSDSDFLKYKVLYSLTSGGALTTLTTITAKTTITYDATGLTPGTKYYFKVYVYDTESLYAGSNEVSATTLTQNAAPTAVTLSAPSGITDTSMNLTWTQNNDTDFLKYKVLYSLTSGGALTTLTTITTKTTTTYTATGLTPSTKYYFKVYVYDTGGAYAASNEVSATAQNQPPTAVTLNAPAYITSSSMKLTWTPNNDSDFLKYKVLYSLTSGGALTTLTEITTKSVAAVYATSLTPSTKYYFKVYVYDTGGLYAASNEVNATTLNAAPTAVTLNAPSYITSSSMKLTWTQNNDLDFSCYKVFYSLTSGGALTRIAQITDKSAAAVYATGLTAGTKYYFKVYVYDTGGLYAASNEVNATTLNGPPTAVTLIAPSGMTTSSLNLSWTQNNDPDFAYYKVFYSLPSPPSYTSGGTFTMLTQINIRGMTSYTATTATGLMPDTPYYFKVYVYDTGGLYAGSNEVYGYMYLPNKWITIPAGDFIMGCATGDTQCFSNEDPKHTVTLSEYKIQKYEVTNAQYKECVDAGVCIAPSNSSSGTITSYYGSVDYGNFPVIYVDWEKAKAYCEWSVIGGRLPTEAEWEKAARGPSPREVIFPWDNRLPSCSLANYYNCVGDTVYVGIYPFGDSYYGVMDMAGNVYEWVNDWYSDSYYSSSPSSDPQGPGSGSYRVMRGGSYGLSERWQLRVSFRYAPVHPSTSDLIFGFRCAHD